MHHMEGRLKGYQPFMQLDSHHTWSRLGCVQWNLKLHTWYEFKTYTEILLDKRCWSITWSLWSHDPCVFYRLEPFCDVKEDWKMTPLIKVFCQRELLVNVSGCQRHLILIYDMILAFPCKSFSVRFDCLKNKILCACALHMISKCF